MLWGGRFKDKPDKMAMEFSSSLPLDINLIDEDIEVNKAHTKMLCNIGILTEEEKDLILTGLEKLRKDFEEGGFLPKNEKFEDIHSAIEKKLEELIGKTAGKMHSGKSRNDQVATDIKLWLRKSTLILLKEIKAVQLVFIEKAEEYFDFIIPGYTHLQRAQPVSLAFHLLAYVEMFERDKERLGFVLGQLKESPLGSGALAGSTLKLDRDFTARELGFDSPTRNALDSVSNRDFVIDFLNACSIGIMHLSRLAEEIILWTSSEWKLMKLSDSFSTGSSLMPQKKNPDMAELVRGKSGRVFGNQFSLLTTLKGLPLSYNRDLQEDKEPLFDSFIKFLQSLQIMRQMVFTATFDNSKLKKEMLTDFSLATDLADWLVEKGIPFREAHFIVGQIVKQTEEKGHSFSSVSLEELKAVHPVFDESALLCLDIKTSLQRKKTFGSPNPEFVSEQIAFWKKRLEEV